jgi:hypothetical protein
MSSRKTVPVEEKKRGLWRIKGKVGGGTGETYTIVNTITPFLVSNTECGIIYGCIKEARYVALSSFPSPRYDAELQLFVLPKAWNDGKVGSLYLG